MNENEEHSWISEVIITQFSSILSSIIRCDDITNEMRSLATELLDVFANYFIKRGGVYCLQIT